IQEIVIDEAQDYTKLQYIILTKIFKNANYTILGDVNQTINPYYKYSTLNYTILRQSIISNIRNMFSDIPIFDLYTVVVVVVVTFCLKVGFSAPAPP
ncbi:MAG: UvrD-helicase domain-containing protein, partial [Lachnospiraceae bacterium]|nr:UvrD-helicase domain-containing protein [Lachnospiraceae bacterium]